MTNGDAVGCASVANRATGGSAAVVVASMTIAVVSVLPVTRPSPGKCLRVPRTPAPDRPATTVPAAAPTAAGVLPYWRENTPTGAFVCSVPAGTTSATGARSRVT